MKKIISLSLIFAIFAQVSFIGAENCCRITGKVNDKAIVRVKDDAECQNTVKALQTLRVSQEAAKQLTGETTDQSTCF